MKQIIAIPTSSDCLCQHFGYCEKFAIFNAENRIITEENYLIPPPHEPGVIPAWLASKGVTHVISGGMGHRAISLFNQHKIRVFTGVEAKPARILAEEFLNEKLVTGKNACDH
jgi:predicted Fe-Mo cluster-binding NifX family protein